MPTNTTKPRLESRTAQRMFSSPVARAFVRIVMAHRDVTESQARQIYLDYLNRTQPHRRGDRPAA